MREAADALTEKIKASSRDATSPPSSAQSGDRESYELWVEINRLRGDGRRADQPLQNEPEPAFWLNILGRTL